MRSLRVAICCCLLAIGLVAGGCGDDGNGGSEPGDIASRPAPPPSDFPSAEGKTLGDVIDEASGPASLVVSPASMVFYKGENRYSFGVFEKDRTQVPDAEVALYFARVPPGEPPPVIPPAVPPGASGGTDPTDPTGVPGAGGETESEDPVEPQALDQPAIGPFTAAVDSLETDPAFRAQTTSNDPDAALAVYTAEIDFPADGEWRIAALIKEGDKLTATLLPSANVGQFTQVPTVGDTPPRIHTPTAAEVGGDLSQITTRVPPDTQNEADFADVLGQKPVVLLFSTPQFCQSRVCGPVVDVAEQVKEQYGDEVEFIHMEIYNENDPSKGVRPQVRAFNLPSEPWLFVMDSEGVITTALEGAFSVDELTAAVEEATG